MPDYSTFSESVLPHTANSPIMFFEHILLLPPLKKSANIIETEEKKITSAHGNIRRILFDQKSPQPPEEGVLEHNRQTYMHTL